MSAAALVGPRQDRQRQIARSLGAFWVLASLSRLIVRLVEGATAPQMTISVLSLLVGIWLLRVRGPKLAYAVDASLGVAVVAIPVQIVLAPAGSGALIYVGFYACVAIVAFGLLPARRALVIGGAVVLGQTAASLARPFSWDMWSGTVLAVAVCAAVILGIRTALADSEARLDDAFERASVAMAFADESGRLNWVNAAFARLIGVGAEELQGQRLQDLLESPASGEAQQRVAAPGPPRWVEVSESTSTGHRDRFLQLHDVTDRRRSEIQQAIVGRLSGAALQGEPVETLHRRLQDEVRGTLGADLAERILIESPGNVRADAAGSSGADRDFLAGVAAVFDSACTRASAEERIRHEARHDSLTGLPNRALFLERLDAALAAPRSPNRTVAVLFLDLDRFKLLNDTLGHSAGDELLRALADRLLDAVGPGDMVARLAGDEFAVLLSEVASPRIGTLVARRLARHMGEPFDVGGAEWVVGASMGIAIAGPTTTVEQLIREADAAMYLAKERGVAHVLFDESLAERTARRFTLEGDLRRALERDELRLAYQPVFGLQCGGRLTGFEALLRWTRSGGEHVGPAEFIPIAEETGLIVPIGRWVLERALAQVASWGAEHGETPAIFVNVSGRQLVHPDMLPALEGALDATGVPPSALHLEITESVLVEQSDRAERLLRRVHELGVHIAIDDFGTGFSSLAYLKRFPVSGIKIDRSFVSGLGTDADDTAIVRATVSMAEAMGLQVVAEGIETRLQLALARDLGCTHAQGFLLGRPEERAVAAARLAAPATLTLTG